MPDNGRVETGGPFAGWWDEVGIAAFAAPLGRMLSDIARDGIA